MTQQQTFNTNHNYYHFGVWRYFKGFLWLYGIWMVIVLFFAFPWLLVIPAIMVLTVFFVLVRDHVRKRR